MREIVDRLHERRHSAGSAETHLDLDVTCRALDILAHVDLDAGHRRRTARAWVEERIAASSEQARVRVRSDGRRRKREDGDPTRPETCGRRCAGETDDRSELDGATSHLAARLELREESEVVGDRDETRDRR